MLMILFGILLGGKSGLLAKIVAEMVNVIIAQFYGNFADGQQFAFQQLLGPVDPYLFPIPNRGYPKGLLKAPPKLGNTEVAELCQFFGG